MFDQKSSCRRFVMGFLIAVGSASLYAGDDYCLRGLTTIGDTTFVAVQEGSTGRTRLLEVGDSANRAVYAASWNPEKREAVIVANGQRMTLSMELPAAEGLSGLNAVSTGPQWPTPPSLDYAQGRIRRQGDDGVGFSDGNRIESNIVGGKQASGPANAQGGGVVVGRSNAAPSSVIGDNHESSGASFETSQPAVPVLGARPGNSDSAAPKRPAVISMLPRNTTALTVEDKEANKKAGAVGQTVEEIEALTEL